DEVDRLLAVVGDPDLIAGGGQFDLEQPGDEGVVVDDEELPAHRLRTRLDLAHRTPVLVPDSRRRGRLPGSLPSSPRAAWTLVAMSQSRGTMCGMPRRARVVIRWC